MSHISEMQRVLYGTRFFSARQEAMCGYIVVHEPRDIAALLSCVVMQSAFFMRPITDGFQTHNVCDRISFSF